MRGIQGDQYHRLLVLRRCEIKGTAKTQSEPARSPKEEDGITREGGYQRGRMDRDSGFRPQTLDHEEGQLQVVDSLITSL